MNRRLLAYAVTAAAVLATTTACMPTHGPDGRVVDRQHTYVRHSGSRYYLTVRPSAGGDPVKFRTTHDVWDSCFHGSHYPACSSR